VDVQVDERVAHRCRLAPLPADPMNRAAPSEPSPPVGQVRACDTDLREATERYRAKGASITPTASSHACRVAGCNTLYSIEAPASRDGS